MGRKVVHGILACAALLLPTRARGQVPLVPPDAEPGWFDDDSSYTLGAVCQGFLKRIVVIAFTPEASDVQRTDALAQVGGRVVGGMRFDDSTGVYLVAVPDASTWAALERVIERLEALPPVAAASGYSCMLPAGSRSTRMRRRRPQRAV